jgi:hypothetical protein
MPSVTSIYYSTDAEILIAETDSTNFKISLYNSNSARGKGGGGQAVDTAARLLARRLRA